MAVCSRRRRRRHYIFVYITMSILFLFLLDFPCFSACTISTALPLPTPIGGTVRRQYTMASPKKILLVWLGARAGPKSIVFWDDIHLHCVHHPTHATLNFCVECVFEIGFIYFLFTVAVILIGVECIRTHCVVYSPFSTLHSFLLYQIT